MYVYVACVLECCGSVCCASKVSASSNSDEPKKLPDEGRPLPKHVGAYILNKRVVQFSACVCCFCYV
jgi:hypothetical protein